MNATKTRFEFLDVLRFLAATAILLQHVLGFTQHWYQYIGKYYFELGIFGVTLFFLVSGFIIPVSLERNGSLKNFWINRIFRIYPLYLLSILVTVLSRYFLFHRPVPAKMIILQVSMLQHFLTGHDILYLYWTLSLEFAFYVMLSFAFFFGFIKKSLLMATIMLAISLFTASVLHISFGWGIVFYITTMFVGTLFYRFMNQQISKTTLTIMLLITAAVFISNSVTLLYDHDPAHFGGGKNFWPVTSSTILAYIVFLVFFVFRDQKYPRYLLYLGMISYSIYIVQGSVFELFHGSGNPYLADICWIILTILISSLTYRFVEKPFIKLSHKLTKVKPVVDLLPGTI